MKPLPAKTLVLVAALLLHGGCSDAEPQGPNLLLITLDTTRADRIGAYGRESARTPVLDGLAARGTLFEEAYSPAPMTLPAHATLMTGLLPPEHGARVNGMHTLAPEVPTLAERLRARGYRTAAFVAAFVLDRRFGLDRGFDVYDDDLSAAYEQRVKEVLSTYRPGDVVVDAALAWLGENEGDSPFFAWVHLYDAHFPWHRHGDDSQDPETEEGTYDGEIAFADRQVGRLLEHLRARGLEERTVVIAVADHGEGLGDHHEIEHAFLLNEEVLHVPWIAAGPGVAAGHRVPSLVTLESLNPTALELCGAAPAGEPLSLVPALRGGPVPDRESYAETDLPWTSFRWAPQRSLTTADWKYIRTPQRELYDRARDRSELANLATARKDVLADLERRLGALEAGLEVRETTVAEVGARELEQLAALGYAVGDEAEAPADIADLADVKERLAVKDLATELRRGVDLGTLTPEQQLDMARRLVEASPETPAFQVHLGEALTAVGALDRAIAPYERSVELAPTDPGTHYALGDALQQLGRTSEARAHLELALELAPDMAAAHVGMGNVLRDEGRSDLAAGEYSEALRLYPEYAEAHYNLAQTYRERGRPQLAVESMRRALEHRPDWDLANRALADLLLGLGRAQESLEHFEAASTAFPRDAALINDLGGVYYQLGRYDEAHGAWTRALEVAPDFYRPLVNLANLAFDFGRDELARQRYERALELAPDLPETSARLARFLATTSDESLRDPARAVVLAERALELSDSGPRVLDTLAVCYAGTGRFEDAIRVATEAESLARRLGQAALASEIGARLALYSDGQPFLVDGTSPPAARASGPRGEDEDS